VISQRIFNVKSATKSSPLVKILNSFGNNLKMAKAKREKMKIEITLGFRLKNNIIGEIKKYGAVSKLG
jgi:hypothetical protein